MNFIDVHAPRKPSNPFAEAVDTLRRAGRLVAPADGVIPGLVVVDGMELTMGQVMDLARQLAAA